MLKCGFHDLSIKFPVLLKSECLHGLIRLFHIYIFPYIPFLLCFCSFHSPISGHVSSMVGPGIHPVVQQNNAKHTLSCPFTTFLIFFRRYKRILYFQDFPLLAGKHPALIFEKLNTQITRYLCCLFSCLSTSYQKEGRKKIRNILYIAAWLTRLWRQCATRGHCNFMAPPRSKRGTPLERVHREFVTKRESVT